MGQVGSWPRDPRPAWAGSMADKGRRRPRTAETAALCVCVCVCAHARAHWWGGSDAETWSQSLHRAALVKCSCFRLNKDQDVAHKN